MNNHWRGHWIKHPAQCNLHGLPTDLVVRGHQGLHRTRAMARTTSRSRTTPNGCGSVRRNVRGDVPDGVHDQVPHDDRGQHEHRLARAAALPAESRRGAPRGARAGDGRRPLHRRVPVSDATGASCAYLDRFLEETELHVDHEVVGVDPRGSELLRQRLRSEYDRLISSIPLPELIPMIEGAPAEVLDAAPRACVLDLRDRQSRGRPRRTSSTRTGRTSTTRTSSSRV